jgi:urease accessory protein
MFAMRQIEHEWQILQLADSAFPSGGFAHSGGLEAAWQLGVISDSKSFQDYLSAQVLQIGRGLLPFVKAAYAELDDLNSIDSTCHAFLNNPVARRASIAQGQAFVFAAGKAFGGDQCLALAGAVRRREVHGHWSPMFGALAAAIGLDGANAAQVFLHINVRGLISAAVRLGIVGPLEGQSIQFAALKDADISTASVESAQTSPMLDLWQGVQDRLYSRLFQS